MLYLFMCVCVCVCEDVWVCVRAVPLLHMSCGGRTQTSGFWQAFQTPPALSTVSRADNGNLIGGRAERAAERVEGIVVVVGVEGGVCGPSFVRNSSKRRPSYLSTGALCNGILHCHFAPFIFRQGYYCSHTPHIPLGFVCSDRVRF